MYTHAVRLYGVNDVRLERFELPPMQEDEILAKVYCDSLCTSSYKASRIGAAHKRVPDNIAELPIILGHEFCGEIIEVGAKWKDAFSKGEKFSIQPALNYQGTDIAPGYSFPYIGGDATYIVIPNVVMEQNCLLKYEGEAYFLGALSEPVSCVIGGCNAMYHIPQGTYTHTMGIKEGGTMVLLAGTGPMGMATIDFCIHGPRRPSLLVVYSRNEDKLRRVRALFNPDDAKQCGVQLVYVHADTANDAHIQGQASVLLEHSPHGYDDVFVMAPSVPLTMIADAVLARDGCLNFFAGPTDAAFSAPFNFYNVHYNFTHVASNSGGNTDDMREALDLMAKHIINPASMITHIGGLNCVVETTMNLPSIPGSKKLVYTHKNIPLTAIQDFEVRGKEEKNELFLALADIVRHNNGLWSLEAEQYLLAHAPEYP